ncbi:MAG: cobalamin biosynthesis protein CbiG [Pseudomonadota bacterium]
MGTSFDQYLIVDWSAASSPKLGKDSIWLAFHDGTRMQWVRNIATRFEAMKLVAQTCRNALSGGKRLFAGFDFAFGYPVGNAKMMTGESGWQAVWHMLVTRVDDTAQNINNTYQLAAALNRDTYGSSSEGPFWGHPHQHVGRYAGLTPTKPASFPNGEYRYAERAVPGAKSLWQLAYNGTVGRQAMLGMGHLEKLRGEFFDDLAIWPFETQFAEDLSKPLCIAEVYPSLFKVKAEPGEVLDATQVRTLASRFAVADQTGELQTWISRPDCLNDKATADVLTEEGWIVGAGHIN